MALLRKQFKDFNGKIRLGKYKEEQVLREKRDIIREKLKDKLPAVFAKYNEANLVPEFIDQGSYKMGTGVKPLNQDYDIDQGLIFPVTKEEFKPVTLKERVREALDGHTKSVIVRRPCVTVQYKKDEEPIYHVDLAVYSGENFNKDGKSYIAMGKSGSREEHKKWEVSNPIQLIDKLFEKYQSNSDQRSQFRRIVRYLKRWKDVQFPSLGNSGPKGIALTVHSFNSYVPKFDPVSNEPNDLYALLGVVTSLKNSFTSRYSQEEDEWLYRVTANLPVEPFTDIHSKMTDKQMQTFYDKLSVFETVLREASSEIDTHEASLKLYGVLGGDFPVPPKPSTGQKTQPPIASSGNAA